MQIVPIDGENQERCQINKGWISSITAFNIFSNKILSGDKDIKAEIDVSSFYHLESAKSTPFKSKTYKKRQQKFVYIWINAHINEKKARIHL